MKAMVWTCDRCQARVEVPQELVVVEWFEPSEFLVDPRCWTFGLDGWIGDSVCPNCITDEEHADRALREAAADVIFGPEDGAA